MTETAMSAAFKRAGVTTRPLHAIAVEMLQAAGLNVAACHAAIDRAYADMQAKDLPGQQRTETQSSSARQGEDGRLPSEPQSRSASSPTNLRDGAGHKPGDPHHAIAPTVAQSEKLAGHIASDLQLAAAREPSDGGGQTSVESRANDAAPIVRRPPGAGAITRAGLDAFHQRERQKWLERFRIPNGPFILDARVVDLHGTALRLRNEGATSLHAAVVVAAVEREAMARGEPSPMTLVRDMLTDAAIGRIEEQTDPERLKPMAMDWIKRHQPNLLEGDST